MGLDSERSFFLGIVFAYFLFLKDDNEALLNEVMNVATLHRHIQYYNKYTITVF